MIEEVTRYKTKDGKLFLSEQKAKDYIANIVQEKINEVIRNTDTFDLKYRDMVVIITALVGDYDKVKAISIFLNKLL